MLCLGCFSNLSVPGLVTPFPAHELGFSGDKEKKMGIGLCFFFFKWASHYKDMGVSDGSQKPNALTSPGPATISHLCSSLTSPYSICKWLSLFFQPFGRICHPLFMCIHFFG